MVFTHVVKDRYTLIEQSPSNVKSLVWYSHVVKDRYTLIEQSPSNVDQQPLIIFMPLLTYLAFSYGY